MQICSIQPSEGTEIIEVWRLASLQSIDKSGCKCGSFGCFAKQIWLGQGGTEQRVPKKIARYETGTMPYTQHVFCVIVVDKVVV